MRNNFVEQFILKGSILILIPILLFACAKDETLSTLHVVNDLDNNTSILQLSTDYSTVNDDLITYESSLLFPECLDESLIDSWIYYFNEFNNYLLADDNLALLSDSLELMSLMENVEFSSPEVIYQFISDIFDIPYDIVIINFQLTSELLPQLKLETLTNHPIATRYYDLIQNNCIYSVWDINGFDSRKGCSFLDVFTSASALALSIFGAGLVETVTVGTGTFVAATIIISAYQYADQIYDCIKHQ
jgi:hypothetical protein